MSSVVYVDWTEFEDIHLVNPVGYIHLDCGFGVPNLEIHYPGSRKVDDVFFTRQKVDLCFMSEADVRNLIADARKVFPKGRIYIQRPLVKMTKAEQWETAKAYLENLDMTVEMLQDEYQEAHWFEITDEEWEHFDEPVEVKEPMEDRIREFLSAALGKNIRTKR